MKKKAGNLVIGIIFLAGLSLLLYPFVANQWNNYRQKQLISGYEQVVSDKEAAEGIDYDAERKKAEDYNEALLPCVLPDSFALAESSGVDPVYMNTLNIAGDEMMGSVEIPKINIKIPIWREVLFRLEEQTHMLLFLHTVDFRVHHFLQIWIR